MNYYERKAKLSDHIAKLREIVSGEMKESTEELDYFSTELESLNFNVLCLGDYNSGKSTFVNKLFLENNLSLPVSVTPTTAKLTMIKYAERLQVKIILKDQTTQVITENIDYELKELIAVGGSKLESIELIEISLPSKILKEGIVIVDSPGLNDPDEKRMEQTYSFIQHADAILYFMSAGQAWKGSEKTFLEDKILSKKELDKVFFILNKWDQIDSQDGKDELLEYVNNEIDKSIKKIKKQLDLTSINKPPLIPISMTEEYNLTKLKEELFSYLDNKNANTILEQKITKYNLYVDKYIEKIQEQEKIYLKDKYELDIEIEEKRKLLKNYKLKAKSSKKKISRSVANKYDDFVSDLSAEYKNIADNYEVNLRSYNIESAEDLKKYSQIAYKKADLNSRNSINNVNNRFKRTIRDIFEDEISDLNISHSKIVNPEYLDAKIFNPQVALDGKKMLPENLAIGAGILGLIGAGGGGIALLAQGGFNKLVTGVIAFVAGGIALAPAVLVAGLGFFVISIPSTFYLKKKFTAKYKKELEKAIDNTIIELKTSYDENIKELRNNEDEVSDLIAENISNEFIDLYKDELKKYKNVKDNKVNNLEQSNPLELKNKLFMLKLS